MPSSIIFHTQDDWKKYKYMKKDIETTSNVHYHDAALPFKLHFLEPKQWEKGKIICITKLNQYYAALQQISNTG